MFQETIDRIKPVFVYDEIFVVAGSRQASVLSKQVRDLPTENFIIEPEERGTAPCIGLAAIHLRSIDSDAVMVVLTADHHIEDDEEFRKTIKVGVETAENNCLTTIGITPSTAYGYIKRGEKISETHGQAVYRVEGFTEKPDKETAKKMVDEGVYFWNSGIFIWSVESILQEFKRQMPSLYNKLLKIHESIGTPDYEPVLSKHWRNMSRNKPLTTE
jgi:mannose-1-phosphate guanylyltransferase